MNSLYFDFKKEYKAQILSLVNKMYAARDEALILEKIFEKAYPGGADPFYTPPSPSQEYLAWQRAKEIRRSIYQQLHYLEAELGIRYCRSCETWQSWPSTTCKGCGINHYVPDFARNSVL